MRTFLRVPQFVWILGILLVVSPRVGYGEENQSKVVSDASQSDAKLKQDTEDLKRSLEKLKRSLEESKKSQQEYKEAEGRSEKARPLADKTLDSVKQEKYEDAKKALREWEKIDPQDFRIPATRNFIARVEVETDPAKRKQLQAEYAMTLLGQVTQQMKEMNSSLGSLNEKLKELGPQNPEEELCEAAVKGEKQKVQELLDQGVRPGAKDRFGSAALSSAVYGGNVEVVNLLIAHGADVNETGLLGMTALISAASNGRVEIVRALIKAKADVHAKTKTGVTALSVAQKNGHSQIVEMLKQAGAKE
jgi:hypothetical protein